MNEKPETPDVPEPSSAHRALDLVALLAVLSVAAVIFALAGPEAFAAVTTAGAGLFTTWRGHHRR